MALPRNKRLPGNNKRRLIPNPHPTFPSPSINPTRPNRGRKDKKKDKGPGQKLDRPGKGKGPGQYYGGLGGYQGVNKKAINRLVNGVLNEEKRDLRRQKQAVRRESSYLTNQANAQYERGLGDLQYVHGETGDYIQNLTGQTQQMYADQQAQQAAASAALQSQLGQTYSGATGDVTAELARLGIQGGGSTAGLSQDQAFIESLARQSGQNAMSTMGMAGTNSNAVSNLVAGMNQGAMTANLGSLGNARADQLGAVAQDRMSQLADINGAMQDAAAGRKDVFFQLLQQLQQTGWSQYMDQQQLNMQRRQMRKGKRRR